MDFPPLFFEVISSQTSNCSGVTLKMGGEQTEAGFCREQRRAAKHAGYEDRARRGERPSICSYLDDLI